jgi:endonuclease-3 related protein
MLTPRQLHNHLKQHFGALHWWPAETPFEVMLGAILTQNTAWSNVEKAIANLRAANCLTPQAILACPQAQLAETIRPSGYFNVKAERLKTFCQWYQQQGGLQALSRWPTDELRHALLAVKGIGPETADDILLYAFERPVFVIDTYTRRLFQRLGLATGKESYEALRQQVEQAFTRDKARVSVFNELHAQIVIHAKEHCRKQPRCHGCPLQAHCREARAK